MCDIASGDDHTIFLQAGGENLYVCGSNLSGQLGSGNVESTHNPIVLQDFKNELENNKIKIIHAGEKSSHVLLNTG